MEPEDPIFQQCLAARKSCALYHHPIRGMIEVGGADRIQFLHNVLSNDIKSLKPHQGTRACLLNAQAKIIVVMNVLRFEKYFWLATDFRLKNVLKEALSKLIVMDRVELRDRSGTLERISVHGPKANALIESLTKTERLKELLDHTETQIADTPLTLIRISLIGESGFSLLVPKEKVELVKAALEKAGESFGLRKLEEDAFEILRIESGISRYGFDFDESNNPIEARLDGAVSFSKGCFPGQEILARLDSRGGVSKKLCGLTLKGEVVPQKGNAITKDGQVVGIITSGVFSPTLKKTIAMGYLPKTCGTAGCSVVVETDPIKIPGFVENLPFFTSLHTTY